MTPKRVRDTLLGVKLRPPLNKFLQLFSTNGIYPNRTVAFSARVCSGHTGGFSLTSRTCLTSGIIPSPKTNIYGYRFERAVPTRVLVPRFPHSRRGLPRGTVHFLRCVRSAHAAALLIRDR
jgi:hypothetical protein